MEENTNFNDENCGYDITIGAYNGEEIRRAYGVKSWPNDQEINGIETDFNSDNSDTHEYVDLGLPSGTLWATTNIQDANGNELYFAWGEIQGYTAEQVGTDKNFSWNDYKFGTIDNISKYNASDGKRVLDAEDDAATQLWGSDWKMPTKAQFDELRANTEYEWTTFDGVQGAKFTSTVSGYTDKFLFFPAVGDAENGGVNDVVDYGNYWSVSLNDKNVFNALELDLDDGGCGVGNDGRCFGYSVRPVRVPV